jgi:hypothetical protein
MVQTAAALPVVAPEVQAFAEEQGVTAYLPAVLELTQRVFPTAHRVELGVQLDPEIANLRFLIIDVFVTLSVSQALAGYQHWNDGLREFCPGPLLCVFCLSVNQGDQWTPASSCPWR